MTMEFPLPPMAHLSLSRDQYNTILAREIADAAALATKWGVEAVGRGYPVRVTRTTGHTFMRAGKWYVVRGGDRQPASAAQARALNATGVAHGVEQVGPIGAA